MKFRTEILPLQKKGLINHKSKITMLGSCFTTNIGGRLNDFQFDTIINPYGIVFNPLSLAQQLKGDEFDEKHTVKLGSKVVSLDFHSKYNADNTVDLKEKYAHDRHQFQERLGETDVLILTFGTAWVYDFLESGKTIANCQKLPNSNFRKRLLKINDLVNTYKTVIEAKLMDSPSLKIILTVSPVRHLKDGLIENNRSKAILIMLCHELENMFSPNVIYFPSYEIVLDDLRDYRFYGKDLLHPNDIAVDYIFDHFQASFMLENTIQLIKTIGKYNQLIAHRNIISNEAETTDRLSKIDLLQKKIAQMKLA